MLDFLIIKNTMTMKIYPYIINTNTNYNAKK